MGVLMASNQTVEAAEATDERDRKHPAKTTLATAVVGGCLGFLTLACTLGFNYWQQVQHDDVRAGQEQREAGGSGSAVRGPEQVK
jgi:hypothetical protein